MSGFDGEFDASGLTEAIVAAVSKGAKKAIDQGMKEWDNQTSQFNKDLKEKVKKTQKDTEKTIKDMVISSEKQINSLIKKSKISMELPVEIKVKTVVNGKSFISGFDTSSYRKDIAGIKKERDALQKELDDIMNNSSPGVKSTIFEKANKEKISKSSISKYMNNVNQNEKNTNSDLQKIITEREKLYSHLKKLQNKASGFNIENNKSQPEMKEHVMLLKEQLETAKLIRDLEKEIYSKGVDSSILKPKVNDKFFTQIENKVQSLKNGIKGIYDMAAKNKLNVMKENIMAEIELRKADLEKFDDNAKKAYSPNNNPVIPKTKKRAAKVDIVDEVYQIEDASKYASKKVKTLTTSLTNLGDALANTDDKVHSLKSKTKQKKLVGDTAAYIRNSGMSKEEVLDLKNENSPFYLNEGMFNELNRLLSNNQLKELFDNVLNFAQEVKKIEDVEVIPSSPPPSSNNGNNKPSRKWSIGSNENELGDLDAEIAKLKKIEELQKRNDQARELLINKRKDYAKYALGRDDGMAVYDYDKLKGASKALKEFNYELEKRNQFQQKYNELCTIVEDYFVGDYSLGGFENLEKYIYINSSMKRLRDMNANINEKGTVQGIKGIRTKDINDLFRDASKGLRSIGANVSLGLKNEEVLVTRVFSRLEAESIELNQEQQKLYDAWQEQNILIGKLKQQRSDEFERKLKEESARSTPDKITPSQPPSPPLPEPQNNISDINDKTDAINAQTDALNKNTEAEEINNKSKKEKIDYINAYKKNLKFLETADDKKMDMEENSWDAGGNNPKNEEESLKRIKFYEEHVEKMEFAKNATEKFEQSWDSLIIKMKDGSKIEVTDFFSLKDMKLLSGKIEDIQFNLSKSEDYEPERPLSDLAGNIKIKQLHNLRTKSAYLDSIEKEGIPPVNALTDMQERIQLVHSILAAYNQAEMELKKAQASSIKSENKKTPELSLLLEELAIKFKQSISFPDATKDTIMNTFGITSDDYNINSSGLKEKYDAIIQRKIDTMAQEYPAALAGYHKNPIEFDFDSIYSNISKELENVKNKGKEVFDSIDVNVLNSTEYVEGLRRALHSITEANSGRPSKYGNDVGVALRNYPELEPLKESKSITDDEFNKFLSGLDKANPYLDSIGYNPQQTQETIVAQKQLNEELVETFENQRNIDNTAASNDNANKVKEYADAQKELNEELNKTSNIIKNISDTPVINSENSIDQFKSQIESLDKEIAVLTEKRDAIMNTLERYDGHYKNSEYVKRIKDEFKSKNFDIAAVLYENLNLSHPNNKFDINKLGKDFVDNFETYLSRGKAAQQILLSQLDSVNSPLGELGNKKHNATMSMLALQSEQEKVGQQNKTDAYNASIINNLDIKTIDDAWKSATNSLGEYKTALKDMDTLVSDKNKLEALSDEEIDKINESDNYFQVLMDVCNRIGKAEQKMQDAKLKITESISKYISLGGNEKFVTDIAEINKDIELLYKNPVVSPTPVVTPSHPAVANEIVADKVENEIDTTNEIKNQKEAAKVAENIISAEERRKQIEEDISSLSEKQLKNKIKTAQNAIAGNKSTAEKYKEELPIYKERYELLVKEREEVERLAAAKRQEQIDTRIKAVTSHVSKNYSAPSPAEVEALFLDKMNEITSKIPTEATNKTWKMDNLTGEISGQLQYINAATKQVVTETYKWVEAAEEGEEAFGELLHISSSFSDKEIDRLEAQRRALENLEKAKTRYNSKLSGVDGQFSNLKEYKDVESAIKELSNTQDSVSAINKVDTAFNVLNKTINEFKQNVKDTGTFDTVKTALNKLNNVDNIVETYRQQYLKMGLGAEEAAKKVESLVEISKKLNAIDLNSETGMKELGETLNEFNSIESVIKNSIPIEKSNIQIAEKNIKAVKAAYEENLKVIKELEVETSNLNNLQAKQDFGSGKSEWANQIEAQNKKVTESAKNAAEAIKNIKKLYDDGKINEDKYTSANTSYKSAQKGSAESQAAYDDKKAAYDREQALKNEKAAADQLKHTLNELVSAYSALAQDSKGKRSATFFEDIEQVKQARNAFEEARNKAVELGLSLEEVSRLEGNAFKNIGTNIGRSGAKIIDEYIAEIDKLEQKLRSSGDLTQKSFNELEHLRAAAQRIQSGKNLDSLNGMQNYLEKLNYFGSRLKGALSEIEKVSKFDALEMQVDYFDKMSYKTATFQSTLSDLKKEWQSFRDLQKNSSDKDIINKAQADLIERTTKALSILHREASGKGNIVEDTIGKISDIKDLPDAMNKYARELGYATKIGSASKNQGDQLAGTYKNQNGEILKLTGTINSYKNAMSVVTNEQKGAAGILGNMNKLLGSAGKHFAMYFSGYHLISMVTQQLRQGMATLNEYDHALTTISYTMDLSSESLKGLGKSALDMANDLNTSVKDALSIYQIYANMQTSSKEIAETAKPTAILSNLSGVDTATAADQVQGILNQFNMLEDGAGSVAEKSMHVVDALDKISANVAIDYAKLNWHSY